MNSQAAVASPFPPQVGSTLVVALARALAGSRAPDPRRPLRGTPHGPGETAPAGSGEAEQIALALRDTCHVVAGELAQRRDPARLPPLAERLSATAGQIGEVLALFDRTTEQMHRLAVDALEAAPGTGALEDGLAVVASEVHSLSLATRRSRRRVALQVQSIEARGSRPRAGRAAAAEMSWSEAAADLPGRAGAQDAGFCLSSWLSRDGAARL